MKLSRDTVTQREDFVRQAVKAEPSITGNQLQALLKQHFGKQMRLMRLYAIKNQTLAGLKKLDLGPEWAPRDAVPYDPD